MVRQLKENKTHQVFIDVFAVKSQSLRLEASASLGYRLASVVVQDNQVMALVPPEKKFYQGLSSAETMMKTLKLPIHPNVFFAIIFDQGLSGGGWLCQANSSQKIESCRYKDAIVLRWERLPDGQKMVYVKTPQVEMDWLFKSRDLGWSPSGQEFVLQAPKSYQVIQL